MELIPGPLYPPLINRPLILTDNDEYKSLLNIKQSFRKAIQESPYFIITNLTEKFNFNSTIERYSDKYSKKKNLSNEWQTDWTRLPSELKYFYEKDRLNVKRKTKRLKKEKISNKDMKKVDLKKIITQNMDVNIKNEGEENEDENDEVDNDEEKSKENEDSDKEDLEGSEEEEIEEENDYIDTYFDNGENYGDDDLGGGGDGDDGPVY